MTSWLNYPITHGYVPHGGCDDCPHFAVDIGTPYGTPITALWDGIVTASGYEMQYGQALGGVVFIRAKNGLTYYYYHLDTVLAALGKVVRQGEIVGYSGGQNIGGSHPVSPVYSDGLHTHVGLFEKFILTADGPIPYGPDITPYLERLKTNDIPAYTGKGGTATTTQKPWWDFSRIDNFGTKDPQGNYWKPDTNVQIPGNYPVTAILPGTVTSVQRTGFGQTTITIRLDRPLNTLATHTFYEHLSSGTVREGQHVSQFDLIGYNNPAGSVPLGFGFYSGDVYGSGTAWTTLQNDLKPGGAGLLNPVAFLNAARGGSIPNSSGGSSPGSSGTGIGVNPPPVPGSIYFAQIGQKIGLIALALVLVIAGMAITFEKQAKSIAGKAVKLAEVAA